jgi:hypothetical protein
MVNAIIVPVALTGLLFCQINSLIFFYIKPSISGCGFFIFAPWKKNTKYLINEAIRYGATTVDKVYSEGSK